MKKIAGKTFWTREELGMPPLTTEEIEDAKKTAREGRAQQRAIPPDQRYPTDDKFSDDLAGTEYDPDWPPNKNNDESTE